MLSPWAVNRSTEFWGAQAEKFVPDRWIDNGLPNNTGGATNNFVNLTFLHGPRSCIGQGFAKAELRCLVAAFVHAFEFNTNVTHPTPSGAITIKPKGGMPLYLKAVSLK
jgi:cytochrome P450